MPLILLVPGVPGTPGVPAVRCSDSQGCDHGEKLLLSASFTDSGFSLPIRDLTDTQERRTLLHAALVQNKRLMPGPPG